MDPNANLDEMRRIAAKLVKLSGAMRPLPEPQVMRFVELFEALDEWCTKEGFLPKAWER